MTTVIDKDKFTKIAQITIAVLIVIVLASLLIFFLTHKGKKAAAPIIHIPTALNQPSAHKDPIDLSANLDTENNKPKTEQSEESKNPKSKGKLITISTTLQTPHSLVSEPTTTPITTQEQQPSSVLEVYGDGLNLLAQTAANAISPAIPPLKIATQVTASAIIAVGQTAYNAISSDVTIAAAQTVTNTAYSLGNTAIQTTSNAISSVKNGAQAVGQATANALYALGNPLYLDFDDEASITSAQPSPAQTPQRHLNSEDLNGFLKSKMEINIKATTFDEAEQEWHFEIEDSKNHINNIPYGWSSWGLLGYKSRPTNIEQDLLDVEFIDFILESNKNTSESESPAKRDKLINFIKLILITKKLNSEEMTEFCQILNRLEPQKPTPTRQRESENRSSTSSEGSFYSADESLYEESTNTITPNNRVDDSTINENSLNTQKN